MAQPKYLKLTVSADDVRRAQDARYSHNRLSGTYNSETECPIAQAMLRTGYKSVRAHPDFLTGYRTPYRWELADRWEATETIRRAMRRFDLTGLFTPCTFITRAY